MVNTLSDSFHCNAETRLYGTSRFVAERSTRFKEYSESHGESIIELNSIAERVVKYGCDDIFSMLGDPQAA
jgi:hypothetical protein